MAGHVADTGIIGLASVGSTSLQAADHDPRLCCIARFDAYPCSMFLPVYFNKAPKFLRLTKHLARRTDETIDLLIAEVEVW